MVNTNSHDVIDFSASVRNFAERKICLQPQRLHIHLPNAKEVLNAGLQHFLGDGYKWQPEYDKVADWLADNKGLGLFCMGNCGRGRPPFACRYFRVSCNTISIKLWQSIWHVR